MNSNEHLMNSPEIPELSTETRTVFEFISDPKNKELFTKEAALKAFEHVDVVDVVVDTP